MFRKHYFVSGKVQGVFFRGYTKKAADALGIKGWVRNLEDGRVEAEIFTDDLNAIKELEAWFRTGSPLSRVEKVEIKDLGESISKDLEKIDDEEFEILR